MAENQKGKSLFEKFIGRSRGGFLVDFTTYLQIYGLFNFVIKSKMQTHTDIFGLFAVPKSKIKLQCSNRVILICFFEFVDVGYRLLLDDVEEGLCRQFHRHILHPVGIAHQFVFEADNRFGYKCRVILHI